MYIIENSYFGCNISVEQTNWKTTVYTLVRETHVNVRTLVGHDYNSAVTCISEIMRPHLSVLLLPLIDIKGNQQSPILQSLLF